MESADKKDRDIQKEETIETIWNIVNSGKTLFN